MTKKKADLGGKRLISLAPNQWVQWVTDQSNLQVQELSMALSPAYLKWQEATLEEGRQEALPEGQREKREMIISLLEIGFGQIDEDLAQIIQPMLVLPPNQYLPLVLQLSREELLARFISR